MADLFDTRKLKDPAFLTWCLREGAKATGYSWRKWDRLGKP